MRPNQRTNMAYAPNVCWGMVAVVALLVGACSGEDAPLSEKLLSDPSDALASIAPIPSSNQAASSELLPKHQTQSEKADRLKADGNDPRDTNANYAYTSAPTDVTRLPGEFEPAQSLLIGFPSNGASHASYFARIIKEASTEVQSILVFVDTTSTANTLRSALSSISADLTKVRFVSYTLDSIWMRDYGPLVVKTKTGGTRVIDLRYYYGRFRDDVIPTLLAKAWNIPVSRPPIETEGGNFQSDGAGTCILTEQTLSQNVGYTATDVGNIYRDFLGCQKTLILPALNGEGTGHVDMSVTITGAKQAIVGRYTTTDDAVNAKRTDTMAKMLTDAGFTVRRIPMPSNRDGAYRSYTNSIAIGNKVLVPVYSDDRRYETEALKVFRDAYPNRTLVTLDSTKIIQWAGATHCVTMTIAN